VCVERERENVKGDVEKHYLKKDRIKEKEAKQMETQDQ
jgi:hypothetical protein